MTGAPEYLRTIAELAAAEWRKRRGASGPVPAGLVRERSGLRAGRQQLRRYLAATEGAAIARLSGPDPLLPPLFPVVWETALTLSLLADERMPSVAGGVVHLESELLLLRCLRAADPAECRLELERVESAEPGERLKLRTRTWSANGDLCLESRTTLLLRRRGRSARSRQRPLAAEEEAAELVELRRWRLRGSHGRRYARASGDYNPIHLTRLSALPFGFHRPILHGFCTAAIAAHALIEKRCGGDPTGLRRLQVAFPRPLPLPTTMRLLVDTGRAPSPLRMLDARETVAMEGSATTGGG